MLRLLADTRQFGQAAAGCSTALACSGLDPTAPHPAPALQPCCPPQCTGGVRGSHQRPGPHLQAGGAAVGLPGFRWVLQLLEGRLGGSRVQPWDAGLGKAGAGVAGMVLQSVQLAPA